jgi:tRNA G10  N-methylase Trm11
MSKHPAIMGPHILKECKEFLPFEGCRVLDPFAGIGTTAKLLPDYDVVGVEIEEEWAKQCPKTVCGDSLLVIPTLGKFDAVLTSPAYGNRMADDFEASDTSKRITYRHKLGRKLSEGTTANLHFGRKNGKYEELHSKIWKVCVDALTDDGVFILNCKDFLVAGQLMKVTDWHIDTLTSYGMKVEHRVKVPSKGMRFGANSEKRIDYECVVCLKKG